MEDTFCWTLWDMVTDSSCKESKKCAVTPSLWAWASGGWCCHSLRERDCVRGNRMGRYERVNTGFDTLGLVPLWDILVELREEIWAQK